MTVELRPMRDSDLDAVMLLETRLFDDAWTRGMFRSELAEHSTRSYVVATDTAAGDDNHTGAIVGYAGLCAYAPDQAFVQTIAVAPDRQGEGIGTTLLRTLLDEAERRGCTQVDLEVRIDNATAIALYERHGFAPLGVRRRYYQPSGTDALVMRRPAEAVTQ